MASQYILDLLNKYWPDRGPGLTQLDILAGAQLPPPDPGTPPPDPAGIVSIGDPTGGGPGPGPGGAPLGGGPMDSPVDRLFDPANFPDPIITDSGQGRGLPRPAVGSKGIPGVHEPGGWQWNGATWQWMPG
jgi:hypothetical protein